MNSQNMLARVSNTFAEFCFEVVQTFSILCWKVPELKKKTIRATMESCVGGWVGLWGCGVVWLAVWVGVVGSLARCLYN